MTLTKYLEEIVAAVVEGASKGKGDPEVAVDVSDFRVILFRFAVVAHRFQYRLSFIYIPV